MLKSRHPLASLSYRSGRHVLSDVSLGSVQIRDLMRSLDCMGQREQLVYLDQWSLHSTIQKIISLRHDGG